MAARPKTRAAPRLMKRDATAGLPSRYSWMSGRPLVVVFLLVVLQVAARAGRFDDVEDRARRAGSSRLADDERRVRFVCEDAVRTIGGQAGHLALGSQPPRLRVGQGREDDGGTVA